MMENVPALVHYSQFKYVVDELDKLGYAPQVKILNVKDYEVPQSRKRFVMVGSILGKLEIAEPVNKKITVRNAIETIESEETTTDAVHKKYPKHSERIMQRIRLTPKNGGSRKDLPVEYILPCHKKGKIGFNDIYGRLRWDDYATTITGGCLNPSKGRFLHPEKNRCITAREAALLQSFPIDYMFPTNISLAAIALLIGNALPPKFSYYQSSAIHKHIQKHIG